MAHYTCPVCQEKVKKDLVAFKEHTDQHVIDVMKQKRPDWVMKDGLCPKCLDYVKTELRGSSSPDA